MKFIIIPKEVYDSVSEEKKRELGTGSPSSEFESVLSSKEWVSDVNNECL